MKRCEQCDGPAKALIAFHDLTGSLVIVHMCEDHALEFAREATAVGHPCVQDRTATVEQAEQRAIEWGARRT